MRELDERELAAPASLPAGVAPAGRASGSDGALHAGTPAAAALGDVPEHARHVAAELLVAGSGANRMHHGPACHPYEDPRFPPPAPALHNGAWIDDAGAVQPWWLPSCSTSSTAASSCAIAFAGQ